MPLFRLIGLALFITAIFLALAAAITKTTHIRIQLPGTSSQPQPAPSAPSVLPPLMDSAEGQSQTDSIQFTSVPIVWPLIIAGGSGLLMWFTVSSESGHKSSTTAKQRSRRRK